VKAERLDDIATIVSTGAKSGCVFFLKSDHFANVLPGLGVVSNKHICLLRGQHQDFLVSVVHHNLETQSFRDGILRNGLSIRNMCTFVGVIVVLSLKRAWYPRMAESARLNSIRDPRAATTVLSELFRKVWKYFGQGITDTFATEGQKETLVRRARIQYIN
jgi:hypothetical protein